MKKVCTVYAPDDSISEFCDEQLREFVGNAVWYVNPSNDRWYLAEELLALRKKTELLEELLAFYEHAANHLENQFTNAWEEAVHVGLRVVPGVADIVGGSVTNLGADFVPIERLTNCEQKVARLRAALREIYEMWAGSEGFIPETAPVGDLLELIKKMAMRALQVPDAD